MEKASRKQTPRRQTEARREQNRIASRNYREKRKQKLALLNQLLDPDDVDFGSGHDSGDANAIASVNDNDTIPIENHVLSQSEPSYIGSILDAKLPNIEDTTSYQQPPFIVNNWNTLPAPAPTASTDTDDTLSKVLQGVETLSLNQKRDLIRLLQKQTDDTTNPPSSPPSAFAPHPQQLSRNSTTLVSQPSHASRSTRLQLEALQFSLALSLTAAADPSRTPNQYVTNTGLFSALFANCYALGMGDVEPLLDEEGWSVFGLGPEIAYHPSQLSVVRAKFRNLTPDLRPCDLQLTFAHHPYIDVLPFKSFRENLLKALVHDPPLVDEDELCPDILAGIVCWGSKHNTLGMGVAVPWDVRCWEPSVWFLHKYRHLVGGWDDGMWTSARRWHSMRGERIQATPATTPSS
ncbi:hypothetical protein QQX98_001955 [Neonectria punicea]|uniref:BZIP domain-containing protein n=1 Tax=Neonectria punicea TaxID=979145 RepID=A0ABR1HL78_9HYPO